VEGSIAIPVKAITTPVTGLPGDNRPKSAKINDLKQSKGFKDLASSLTKAGVEDAETKLLNVLDLVDGKLEDIDRSIDLLMGSSKIVAKMVGKMSDSSVAQNLLDIEKQAVYMAVQCQFNQFGVGVQAIRNWILQVASEQIENGTIKLSDNLPLEQQINIGTEEFNQLLKGNNIGLVTTEAFDFLFGDQSGGYDPKIDNMKLAAFTKFIKEDVEVFYGQMSETGLTDMLSAFASTKFLLLKNSEMSANVKNALFSIIKLNIAKGMPDVTGKDGKLISKEKERNDLAQLAEKYLNAGEIEKLFGIEGSKQTDIKKDGKPAAFNYLEGYETAMLVKAIAGAKRGGLTGDRMYATAGFGCLWNSNNSVRTKMFSQGGDQNKFSQINTNDDEIRNELYRYICSWGLNDTSFRFDRSKVKEIDVIDALSDANKMKKYINNDSSSGTSVPVKPTISIEQ
jgi:hypothetical protein